MALSSNIVDVSLLDATLADTVVLGDATDNVVPANAGNDYVDGREGNNSIFGGAGNDVLIGGAGADFLSGQDGNDILLAGSGDDRVLAGTGTDIYDGGSGFDTLDFGNMASGLTIDISKGTATGSGMSATFDSFETVIGTSFSDNIKGSTHDDVILGGRGDDMIRSLAGEDTLTGGAGHDTYKFMAKDVMVGGVHQGVDVITDFSTVDTLDLRDFFKSKVVDVDSIVQMRDTAEGAMVSVKIGDAFVDVALLQGMYGGTASGLAADGMMLV